MSFVFHSGMMPTLVNPLPAQFVFDRSQATIVRERMVCLTPIGKVVSNPKAVRRMCEERAEQIVRVAAGRKIYVMWSGGIDSTVALLALLKVANHSDLVILMDQTSIDEYPELYARHIEGKLAIEPMNPVILAPTIERIVTAGGIVVTGEIGDQIFGSAAYLNYENQADLLQPWETLLSGVSQVSINQYRSIVGSAPRPIVTLKDFWWWLNYCLKYQGVQLRMLIAARSAAVEGNVFHFFDTADWNDYAVSTPTEDKYPGTTLSHYKLPLKQYILEETGDRSYFADKLKVPSLQGSGTAAEQRYMPVWIDSNWNRGYK